MIKCRGAQNSSVTDAVQSMYSSKRMKMNLKFSLKGARKMTAKKSKANPTMGKDAVQSTDSLIGSDQTEAAKVKIENDSAKVPDFEKTAPKPPLLEEPKKKRGRKPKATISVTDIPDFDPDFASNANAYILLMAGSISGRAISVSDSERGTLDSQLHYLLNKHKHRLQYLQEFAYISTLAVVIMRSPKREIIKPDVSKKEQVDYKPVKNAKGGVAIDM